MQFTALVVALVVTLGMLIALLLNQSFPGRGLVRTLILLPWAIPPVVNGLMWQWIYDSKVGALNGLLVSLGVHEGVSRLAFGPDLGAAGAGLGGRVEPGAARGDPVAGRAAANTRRALRCGARRRRQPVPALPAHDLPVARPDRC